MRRRLIVVLTFLAGVYYFVEFFLPEHIVVGGTDFQWNRFDDEISLGVRVFFAMAFGLGVINILRVHGYMVIRRRKHWINSLALLVAMFVTAVAWDPTSSKKSGSCLVSDTSTISPVRKALR